MKKLLKLLFITTMAVIPLSSSIALTACNFAMDSTEIALNGVNRGSIYIDALPAPYDEEYTSPRKNNKIIDIRIKNPQKGYSIIWKIKDNWVKLPGIDGNNTDRAQLIAVESVKNDPGSANVSLRVSSKTYIKDSISLVSIEFLYFNPKTNSTIIPDMKNRNLTVEVHKIIAKEKEVANEIELSALKYLEKENIYDFNHKDAAITRETFLDSYIINYVDQVINGQMVDLDFILGVNYNIYLNGVNDKQTVNEIINDFYNDPTKNEIIVEIKSIDKMTEGSNLLTGNTSYLIKNSGDVIAPKQPGAKPPNSTITLKDIVIESYAYNFKNVDKKFIELFPENYVHKYVDQIISLETSGQINSADNYIVTLRNENNYELNFWEDPGQQQAISGFFNQSNREEIQQITFDVKARANQPGDIIAADSTSFSFTNDSSAQKAPTIPGKEDVTEFINIAFNVMFDKALVDLTEMGEGNEPAALLKEEQGGLILNTAIILANTQAIKESVSKGFDIFHSEVTHDKNIIPKVIEKKTGNALFDDNVDNVKYNFIKIIRDKSNWTIKSWKNLGKVGGNVLAPGANETLKDNNMSVMSYELTNEAHKKLKEIKIIPSVDSFRFPMYVKQKATKDLLWNDYFGHKNFSDQYLTEKMGLILGNSNEYLSSVPGEENNFEKNVYDDILTQQALGTFSKGGIPGKDQNFYLTSGSDFTIGDHINKSYDFTLTDSDKFKSLNPQPSIKNIRGIYGNDIVKELISTYSKLKLSQKNSSQPIDPLIAQFQNKKIKMQYDDYGTGPAIESGVPKEIGNSLTIGDPIQNKVERIENSYFLDLTSEPGYFLNTAQEWDLSIDFNTTPTSFNEVLLDGKNVPSNIDSWNFLEGGRVGTTEEQERNWLKYNVYMHTNKNGAGRSSRTIKSLTPSQPKIIDVDDSNSNAAYLYINALTEFGGGSEIADKSIRHIVIKVNKK